jgi:hypothetical protein
MVSALGLSIALNSAANVQFLLFPVPIIYSLRHSQGLAAKQLMVLLKFVLD